MFRQSYHGPYFSVVVKQHHWIATKLSQDEKGGLRQVTKGPWGFPGRAGSECKHLAVREGEARLGMTHGLE